MILAYFAAWITCSITSAITFSALQKDTFPGKQWPLIIALGPITAFILTVATWKNLIAREE